MKTIKFFFLFWASESISLFMFTTFCLEQNFLRWNITPILYRKILTFHSTLRRADNILKTIEGRGIGEDKCRGLL